VIVIDQLIRVIDLHSILWRCMV